MSFIYGGFDVDRKNTGKETGNKNIFIAETFFLYFFIAERILFPCYCNICILYNVCMFLNTYHDTVEAPHRPECYCLSRLVLTVSSFSTRGIIICISRTSRL